MKTLIALVCTACLAAPAFAQDTEKQQADNKLPTIAGKVEKLEKIDGFVPLYPIGGKGGGR